MSIFRGIPIQRKLMFITMMTSLLALLLACSAFVIYEQFTYQKNLIEELETTAGIIGDNCASSLSFADPASAEESLRSLSHQKSITSAAIYDAEGNVFARYERADAAGESIPPIAKHDFYQATKSHAERFKDIWFNGERIGIIYIRHHMAELQLLQRNYMMIAGGILLVVSMISWVISSRLQRVISGPVASLAGSSPMSPKPRIIPFARSNKARTSLASSSMDSTP